MKSTDLLCLSIIKEVGPVGVGLHEAKLEQFHQAHAKHLLTYVVSWLLIYLYTFIHWSASNQFRGEDLLIKTNLYGDITKREQAKHSNTAPCTMFLLNERLHVQIGQEENSHWAGASASIQFYQGPTYTSG